MTAFILAAGSFQKLIQFCQAAGLGHGRLVIPPKVPDLPLKVLVLEDNERRGWLSYNGTAYLQERHDLPQELLKNIAIVENLVAAAAG